MSTEYRVNLFVGLKIDLLPSNANSLALINQVVDNEEMIYHEDGGVIGMKVPVSWSGEDFNDFRDALDVAKVLFMSFLNNNKVYGYGVKNIKVYNILTSF